MADTLSLYHRAGWEQRYHVLGTPVQRGHHTAHSPSISQRSSRAWPRRGPSRSLDSVATNASREGCSSPAARESTAALIARSAISKLLGWSAAPSCSPAHRADARSTHDQHWLGLPPGFFSNYLRPLRKLNLVGCAKIKQNRTELRTSVGSRRGGGSEKHSAGSRDCETWANQIANPKDGVCLFIFCFLGTHADSPERDPAGAMGMHVPSPVDAGEQLPCARLIQSSASGRQQHGKPSEASLVVSVIDVMRQTAYFTPV